LRDEMRPRHWMPFWQSFRSGSHVALSRSCMDAPIWSGLRFETPAYVRPADIDRDPPTSNPTSVPSVHTPQTSSLGRKSKVGKRHQVMSSSFPSLLFTCGRDAANPDLRPIGSQKRSAGRSLQLLRHEVVRLSLVFQSYTDETLWSARYLSGGWMLQHHDPRCDMDRQRSQGVKWGFTLQAIAVKYPSSRYLLHPARRTYLSVNLDVNYVTHLDVSN
jgi:hypothetical protein